VTEGGWSYLENTFNSLIPVWWYPPKQNSYLFEIPDNAEDSWLEKISYFVYNVEKYAENRDLVESSIRSHHMMNSGLEAQQYSKENVSNFNKLVESIKKNKVKERIHFIKTQRYAAKLSPVPKSVEVGDLVRHRNGVDTATVTDIFLVEGKDINYKIAKVSNPIYQGRINFLYTDLVVMETI
jgi:hypothetical protein